MVDSIDQLGTSAMLARAYSEDQSGFLTLIAGMLEGVMPEDTVVERKPLHLFSSRKRVTRVKVTVGDFVYEMHTGSHEGSLVARRTKIVRGIELKTESLSPDVWMKELAGLLTEQARRSEQSFYALKSFLQM